MRRRIRVRPHMRIPCISRLLLVTLFACSFTARGEDYRPGKVYFDEEKYIEYQPGTLPIVLTSPHGGSDEPEKIPTRKNGVVVRDGHTQDLTRRMADELEKQTGERPHMVICLLHRRKVDCNRDIEEAAGNNPAAERAWREYHGFIEKALNTAVAEHGKAFIIDVHGHGHPDPRAELGYLHTQETLSLSDSELDEKAAEGSLRAVVEHSKLRYSQLLRGPRSIGALMEARGFPCTPSPERPTPLVPYFKGGYTTRRYTTDNRPIAGFQVETPVPGLRATVGSRAKFAKALAETLREYLPEQFGLALPSAKSAKANR